MTDERTDLMGTLAKHRDFLRFTVRDLTDADAAKRPTVSALCLGGIIKHVTLVERRWANFMVNGPGSMGFSPESIATHMHSFEMEDGETLDGLLADYAEASAETEKVVAGLPDLDVSHPLPEAPWFEPGAVWSARRVLVHILAETAQHAGHADIIRESLDGGKTMG